MYYSENLNDDVYFCVLKQAYEMYKLFVGSFQSLVKNESNITNLKLKISNFFSKVLLFLFDHYFLSLMNVTETILIFVSNLFLTVFKFYENF